MGDSAPVEPAPDESGGTFTVTQLTGSFEAFGLTADFLSRVPPYSGFDLGNFARALRRQLNTAQHVAAIADMKLVGYCGWLKTPTALAEAWVKGEATLTPDEGADAAALTVVAANDRRILLALIRRARALNPGIRIYFKRDYAGARQAARKSSVLNIAG